MNNWYYKDTVIESIDQFPKDAVAFVYRITRLSDGKSYIGKKLIYFTSTKVRTITLKNGTKKKKKIKELIESDWVTYWSSSKELVEEVNKLGENQFIREILCFCSNKSSASYYEARYQMDERVLEKREHYFNGIVNLRVNHAHLKPIIE